MKTGTSQAYHDNWTVGYTRDVTVGVWVGNFDRTPLRDSTGVTGAGPIFHAVMLAAQRRAGATVTAFGDARSQSRPRASSSGNLCPLRHAGEPLVPGAAARARPRRGRPALQLASPDRRRPARCVAAGVPPVGPESGLTTDRLPAVRQAVVRHVAETARVAPLTIANPPAGATYLIDPTLRREFQTLALRAVATVPGSLEWRVDDVRVGSAAADASLAWPLAIGSHVISVHDRHGNSAHAQVVVK